MKTIKQIADELGVSKQAIFKKMKKEPLSTSLQGFTSTVDGKLTVSVDGETIIKSAFEQNKPSTVGDNQPSTSSRQVDAMIAMLRDELKAKDDQIATLTKQLDDTHRLLDQQQQLQQGIQKQLEEKNKQWTFRLPWAKKKAHII